MKKIITLSLGLLLAQSSFASDCFQFDQNREICQNDTVYKTNLIKRPSRGTVQEMNKDGLVSVKFDSGKEKAYDYQDLLLAKGCANDVCVGNIIENGVLDRDPSQVLAVSHDGKILVKNLNNGLLQLIQSKWNMRVKR